MMILDIKKLSTESFSSFRQNKISIIFQDLRLFENQTVRENIEIKRMLDPYHQPAEIDEMAKRLGIESKLKSSLLKPAAMASSSALQLFAH